MINQLSLQARILLMSAFLAAPLAATTVLTIAVTLRNDARITAAQVRNQQAWLLTQTRENFAKATVATIRYAGGDGDQAAVADGHLTAIAAGHNHLHAVLSDQDSPLRAPTLAKTLQDINTRIAHFATRFSALQSTGGTSTKRLFETELAPTIGDVSDQLETMTARLRDEALAILQQTPRIIHEAWLWLLVAATLILTLVLGISQGRALGRPVDRLANAVTRLGNRDYDTDVPGTQRGDEIGAIARNLTGLRDTLRIADAESRHDAQINNLRTRLFEALSTGLEGLVRGDLAQQIPAEDYTCLDEDYSSICNDFNTLTRSLTELIAAMQDSAATVRSGAGEINQVAQDLARRTETQAATLEQSAAALDELTHSVRSAAENAGEAAEAVAQNRSAAETSGAVVRDAIAAMQHIQESSSQITRIISVIDDIAFQTNLLALNAGVEAARAGDAGRGFAVVASEVRALAQRASESAHEIKILISRSASQVEEGDRLVGATGTALEEFVIRISQVSTLVSDIAVSAREQATGLQEINSGVNDLDQVTQQNAAVVQQATASSQRLDDEAERLSAVLSRFDTGRGVVMAPAKAASLARPHRSSQAALAEVPLDSGWQDF